MTDYSEIGLNQYLQPTTAPVVTQRAFRAFVSAFDFDSQNDRGAVGNIFLRDRSITATKVVAASLTTNELNFTPVTDTNVIATINASAEGINIEADNIALSGASTFDSGYDPSSKITTFYQDAIPTSLATGDLWVDTNDKNKLYRAASAGANEIKAGEWVAARDTDIAQAITNAATAQSTADSKIVTFYQDSIPTATDAGDLWIDTNDGNKMYRSTAAGDNEVKAGEWVAVPDANKLDSLGGAYNSAGSGARVRIFPDANTGIVAIDDAAGEVFKVLVGGTDVGDVIIGDFSGNKGVKWDKSAATFTVRGILHAPDISVGGTVGVAINLGTTNVALDGANKRILINDGTNDRILIGYQSGGF